MASEHEWVLRGDLPDSPNGLRDALAAHLVKNGLAEVKSGYGHATGEQVATAVLVWLGLEADDE